MPRTRVHRRTSRRSSRRAIALVALALIVAVAVARILRRAPLPTSSTTERAGVGASGAAPATAAYVGPDACATCHRSEFDAWMTSQHRQAMMAAASGAVEGRFDNRSFTYGDVVSTFSKEGDAFHVRTDGADGRLQDFAVKYTFGVFPLQQYLIEMPRGRLQALSIAWDARPPADGGQRWFHLYPGDHVTHADDLHWTGRLQNWNFMCADCHSTAVRRNYDAATDSYQTSWSAPDVTCESCHGPGSQHVEWARAHADAGASSSLSSFSSSTSIGLTVNLDERRGVAWHWDAGALQPVRSAPRTTSREIETCAVCHSRRAQLADGYAPGAPFGDFYELSTLDPGLYFPDGQQQDEVYTYASFLESRMASAGVTCSDCHDPHTGTVKAQGNALCTQCHLASRYDTTTHHHHAAASAGAACVACHMPARTYMQIDDRRDHGLRVPRPDLTVAIGTPNACSGCHRDHTAQWAADRLVAWDGHAPSGFQDFGQAFHDFDSHHPGSDAAVAGIVASSSEPAIVRASALARLASASSASDIASHSIADPDPLVRRAAEDALAGAAPADRLIATSLLADPIRNVRIAAARLLAPVADRLSGNDRSAFDRAAAELVASERFNADRPEHRVSLGVFLSDTGKLDEAANENRAAIGLAPDYVPAYVNLAELLRTRDDEPAAEQTLRDGLAVVPESADLHYALGLSLTRSHRAADALAEFARAAALAPKTAEFNYAYGLALNDAGRPGDAIRALKAALAAEPDNAAVSAALQSIQGGRVR